MDRVLMAQEWRDYPGDSFSAFLEINDLYYDKIKQDYFKRSVRDAAIEKRRTHKNAEYQRRYYQRHKKKIREYNRLYKQRRKLEKSRTVQAEPVYPANRTGKLEVI